MRRREGVRRMRPCPGRSRRVPAAGRSRWAGRRSHREAGRHNRRAGRRSRLPSDLARVADRRGSAEEAGRSPEGHPADPSGPALEVSRSRPGRSRLEEARGAGTHPAAHRRGWRRPARRTAASGRWPSSRRAGSRLDVVGAAAGRTASSRPEGRPLRRRTPVPGAAACPEGAHRTLPSQGEVERAADPRKARAPRAAPPRPCPPDRGAGSACLACPEARRPAARAPEEHRGEAAPPPAPADSSAWCL
jgi:hypothetical protein